MGGLGAGGRQVDERSAHAREPRPADRDIPVLLLYGGQDQTVPPASNAELFAARFKAAGGRIDVEKRGGFGHHPHGVDPNKTARIVNFVTTAK